MHIRSLAAAAILAAAVACDREPIAPTESSAARTSDPTTSTAALSQPDQRTPFQQSLMRALAQRAAQGLPVPASVVYEYAEGAAPASPAAALTVATPPERRIIARTTLQFENVQQAGMAQWPAIVVQGDVPAGARGYIHAGDYTQFTKDKIAEQYPNVWNSVSYETGPRVYTFAESLTVSASQQAAQVMDVQLDDLGSVTSADRLLLGFTVLGPNIDYSISYDLNICVFWFFGCVAEVELVDFWAGFQLDWTIGTRLPMAMSVTHPASVTEGLTFPATSIATGEDWTGAAYQALGISPEDGKEFVLRFIFRTGVFLEVFDADVVDLGVDINLDEGSSFATPLGPGQTFDLPTLNVSIWGFDVAVASADVGVALTPQAGSDRYAGAWDVSAEGAGGGNVTYTTSGQTVSLGNIAAVDGPGSAVVELSGFRYYFNQFGLDLGVYFYLSVLGYGSTWTIPVTDFDLSGIAGGLFVGPHSGTASTVALAIPIENVTPAVTIERGGAIPVNGTPTFLAKSDEAVAFTGLASDPGRDDLTLSWHWGDATPDPATTYAVPHTVTEHRSHVFDQPCVYQVTLRAVDDDQAAGEDGVPVVVTGGAGYRARSEGYWQHQFGRMGHVDFAAEQLMCYLGIVEHMSAVFGETRDVSTIPQAFDVLLLKQHRGDGREQLDRELLVSWLHFAVGAIDITEPVPVGGRHPDRMPFADAMAAIEAARQNPGTSPYEIRRLTSLLHHINVSQRD